MPTTQPTPRPAPPAAARDGSDGTPRPEPRAPDRAAALAVLVALLVVVAVLGAALAGPVRLGARPVAPPVLPTLTAQPPSPAPTRVADRPPVAQEQPPEWAGTVVAVLLVLATAAVLALLARWLLRRRWTGPSPGDDGLGAGETDVDDAFVVAALRAGVASAARALDDDVPPGDAVVAAWVAVEEAAAASGVVRDRAQTATEFTLDVLDGTRADPAATRALLALYLAARFGAHAVTAGDVARARDLLAVVGEGLARRAEPEPAGGPAAGGRDDGTTPRGPGDAGSAP